MSQINTAPEINPTVLETHPTQTMLVKPVVEIVDFYVDDITTMTDTKTFSIEQLDWLKLSQKNKYITSVEWPITTITQWYSQAINLDWINQIIPVGRTFNSFTKFTRIMISIKPTSNALMQGLSCIYFDPSPLSTYLSVVMGIDPTVDNRSIWQFKKSFISPNNSNEINFLVPVNFPFEFFKWSMTSGSPNLSQALADYHGAYTFGTVRIQTIVPLATTSPALLSLNFTVSAQVIDLETAGLKITGLT